MHNLLAMDWREHVVDHWAIAFDDWLIEHVHRWDIDGLSNYRDAAPYADLAVPLYGNEHLIPLFYAMGAADDKRQAKLLHRGYRYGNQSHMVWRFG